MVYDGSFTSLTVDDMESNHSNIVSNIIIHKQNVHCSLMVNNCQSMFVWVSVLCIWFVWHSIGHPFSILNMLFVFIVRLIENVAVRIPIKMSFIGKMLLSSNDIYCIFFAFAKFHYFHRFNTMKCESTKNMNGKMCIRCTQWPLFSAVFPLLSHWTWTPYINVSIDISIKHAITSYEI